jgi:hypothetical protein
LAATCSFDGGLGESADSLIDRRVDDALLGDAARRAGRAAGAVLLAPSPRMNRARASGGYLF